MRSISLLISVVWLCLGHVSHSEAEPLRFKICWYNSGQSQTRCNESQGALEQRTGVDLAGISSFHTLSLSKIYGAAQPAIEYICLYKPYPPPGENPDTQPSVSQTISDGSFCGGNAGSSQYIQSFKIHLTGPDEEKKKHILAYRCKLSIYGSPQQDADPSDGGWYTDASVGCGSSPGTRKWLSSIEVYVYSYPEFP